MPVSNLRRLRAVAFCSLLSASFACDAATAPVDVAATANVVIVGDSAVAITTTVERGITWMRFPLTVAITNTGRVPLQFELCASSVEQENGTGWQGAWSPICALSASMERNELQPGETMQQEINVDAALAGPAAPQWSGLTPPGNIRFRAGIVARGVSGTIPTVASNKIRLVLQH